MWDLMCGIGPWHIQMLCVTEMGMGYTPKQVGEMTLDSIFMLLADKKILRRSTKRRTVKGMIPSIDEDGIIRGRAKDGTQIKGRIAGKSVARQLMEEEERKRLGLKESKVIEKEPSWKIRSRKRAERRAKRNNK